MCCDKNRELLSAFMDGTLNEEEARKVRAHLEGCEACRDALRTFETMKADVASLSPMKAPPGFKDALMQKMADDLPQDWGAAKGGSRSFLRRLPVLRMAAGFAIVAISAYLIYQVQEETSRIESADPVRIAAEQEKRGPAEKAPAQKDETKDGSVRKKKGPRVGAETKGMGGKGPAVALGDAVAEEEAVHGDARRQVEEKEPVHGGRSRSLAEVDSAEEGMSRPVMAKEVPVHGGPARPVDEVEPVHGGSGRTVAKADSDEVDMSRTVARVDSADAGMRLVEAEMEESLIEPASEIVMEQRQDESEPSAVSEDLVLIARPVKGALPEGLFKGVKTRGTVYLSSTRRLSLLGVENRDADANRTFRYQEKAKSPSPKEEEPAEKEEAWEYVCFDADSEFLADLVDQLDRSQLTWLWSGSLKTAREEEKIREAKKAAAGVEPFSTYRASVSPGSGPVMARSHSGSEGFLTGRGAKEEAWAADDRIALKGNEQKEAAPMKKPPAVDLEMRMQPSVSIDDGEMKSQRPSRKIILIFPKGTVIEKGE